MTSHRRIACALAGLALLPAACGGDEEESSARNGAAEPAERPARPPPGWRTVRNSAAGFTVSVPKRWTAATKRGATLIRSDDRLVSIAITGDRSRPGRELALPRYARRTIRGLPAFEGSVGRRARRVHGSPYESARVEASGILRTSSRPVRISVAAFRRPGAVTYSAIVFRNAAVKPRFNDRRIDRLLRSLRGGARRR